MTPRKDRLKQTATGALAAALLLNPIVSPVAMYVHAQEEPDVQAAESEKETSGQYGGAVSSDQSAKDFLEFMETAEIEQATASEIETTSYVGAETYVVRPSQEGKYLYLDQSHGYDAVNSYSMNGSGKVKFNTNHNGATMSLLLDGERIYFTNGYGIHANGQVSFDVTELKSQYPILDGYVGVDACQQGTPANVRIIVKASEDGAKWDTVKDVAGLTGDSNAIHLRMEIGEYNYIRVYADRNGYDFNDHVSLADFRVLAQGYDPAEEAYTGVMTVEEYDREISSHSVQDNFTHAEYRMTVLKREFVDRIGYQNIQFAYKNDPQAVSDTLEWLLGDQETLQLFLEAGEYYLGSSSKALDALVELYTAYRDDVYDENPIYKKMLLATAAAHSKTIYNFAHYSNSGNLNYSTPTQRYQLFKALYDNDDFVYQAEFEQYPMELIRAVVDSRMDNDEVRWLRDYIDYRYPSVTNGNRYGGYGYTWYNSGYSYSKADFYAPASQEKWTTKYRLAQYPEVQYGVANRFRIWMVMESGAICWGISGLGSAVNEVQGIPSIGCYQPGHEPYLLFHYNNGQSTWSIETSVGGWSAAYSQWTPGYEYRLPLEWGCQSYVSKGKGSMNASYILLSQDALNDYDNYVDSMLYNLIANSYPMGSEDREAALEASLEQYSKNLDSLYGYYLSYSADPDTTEKQWLALAKRITHELTYFPKPMADLLNLVKQKVTSENAKAELDILRYDALSKASVATTSDSLQNAACKEIAKSLLGQSTQFATFSFDGDNAKTIVIDPLYEEYNMQIEVSLDGGDTLEEFENGETYTEEHRIVLTPEQIKKINHETDIVIGLRGVNTKHVIDIQKGSAVGNGIYVNDDENLLISYGTQTKNLEYSVNDGVTWEPYEPGLKSTTRMEGDVTAWFRYKATGVYTAGDPTPIEFHANTDPDECKYLQLQHVEMVGYSSQNSANADHAAINLIDGNGNTAWHSTFGVKDTGKYYVVKFDRVRFINKITYLPGGQNGRWKAGTVYSSLDGETWVPVYTFSGWRDSAELKTAAFDMAYPSLYLKVVLTNTYGNSEGLDKYTSGKMLGFYEDTTKEYDPADIPAITQTAKLMDMNVGDVTMAPISIHQGTAIPVPMSGGQDRFQVVWTTSNDRVATVQNGQVIAHGAGDAVISVTVTSKIGLNCQASLYVTVQDPDSGERNFPSAFESQVVAQPFDITTTYEKRTQAIQSGSSYVIYSGARILYHANGTNNTDHVTPAGTTGTTITPDGGYAASRQLWILEQLEDGRYTIRSREADGAYLNLNDAPTPANSRIPVSNTPKAVTIEPTANGGFVIYHEVDGQKLYLAHNGSQQHYVSATPCTFYLYEEVNTAGYYEYTSDLEGLSSLVDQVKELEQGSVADKVWAELMDALKQAETLVSEGPYVYDNDQEALEKTAQLNMSAAALYDAWCAFYSVSPVAEYLEYVAQVKEMLDTDSLLTANASKQLTAAVTALEEAATAAELDFDTLDAKRVTLENLVHGLYTISVDNQAKAKGLYGELYTIQAPAAQEGSKFVGWTVDGKTVSTKESYTFAITGTADYVPAYVEEEEEVAEKAAAHVTSTIGTKRVDGKVDAKFVAQLTVPQGYKMLEVGLLWALTEGGELCTAQGPTTEAKKTSVSQVNCNYQYSVTINAMPKGRFVRAAAYAKLQSPDGSVIWVYSGEHRISNP